MVHISGDCNTEDNICNNVNIGTRVNSSDHTPIDCNIEDNVYYSVVNNSVSADCIASRHTLTDQATASSINWQHHSKSMLQNR